MLRVTGFVIGIALLMLFLQSISRTALVNQRRGDRLAHGVGRIVCSTLSRLAAARDNYDAVQDVMAWVLPLYTLLLILTWFVLVFAGFSLLFWSCKVEASLLDAAIASGSSLTTLGFMTPRDLSGQWLAIVEGAVGLGVVVFYFTFIPGYQTSIQARELKVAWVYARTGVNPTGFALIGWLYESDKIASSRDLWEEWENWFRQLVASLTLTPVLAFVPTLERGQTWLAAAASILDATAFCLAVLEDKGSAPATLCYQTGVGALQFLAAQSGRHGLLASSRPSWHSARASFEAAYQRIGSLGVSLRPDVDESWHRFIALRRPYEGALAQLASKLLISRHDCLSLSVEE